MRRAVVVALCAITLGAGGGYLSWYCLSGERRAQRHVGGADQRGARARDDLSCGPVALYTVLSALGAHTSVGELTRLVSPKGGKSSMLDLARAASRKGFRPVGMRVSYRELCALRRPVVVWLKEEHFVAVLKCDDKGVLLGGAPWEKTAEVPRERFERTWTGEVLAVYPAARRQGADGERGVSAWGEAR